LVCTNPSALARRGFCFNPKRSESRSRKPAIQKSFTANGADYADFFSIREIREIRGKKNPLLKRPQEICASDLRR
jgi:hypothetical protein